MSLKRLRVRPGPPPDLAESVPGDCHLFDDIRLVYGFHDERRGLSDADLELSSQSCQLQMFAFGTYFRKHTDLLRQFSDIFALFFQRQGK